jgi:hypothetical protein
MSATKLCTLLLPLALRAALRSIFSIAFWLAVLSLTVTETFDLSSFALAASAVRMISTAFFKLSSMPYTAQTMLSPAT